MNIIEIDKLVYNGFGIGKLDGKVIFVDYVLPFEKIKVEIVKEKKTHLFGKVIEILETSENRTKPYCDNFYRCGGCQWQHIKYPSQLKFKKEILLESLRKTADIEYSGNIEIISAEPFFYRNRVKFKIQNNLTGFYEKKSHRFIPVNECPVLTKEINEFLKSFEFDNFNNDNLEIFSNSKNEILTSSDNKNSIIEYIKNYKYRINKKSFFQSNKLLTSKLMDLVENYSKNFKIFADLFSGVGFFTVPLGKILNKGIGIESNKFSFKDSIKNVNLNRINNVKLYNKIVEKSFKIIKELNPDLIIADPPRAGINKIFLENLLKIISVKRIIYISCNPVTFSRDLNIIKNNFSLKNLFLIDMFPNSYHIEVLGILDRQG